MSGQAQAVLAHIRRVEQSLSKLREPIEVAPFLAWCSEREARIRRELDHYPQISGSRDGGVQANDPEGAHVRERLLMQLGWDIVNGDRRLYRWTHETAGLAERAVIEDALDAAGALFTDVYPDLAGSTGWPSRLGMGHKMTDEQLLAAHTIYTQGKLTIQEIAERIWQRFGYASGQSAHKGLENGWRHLGLPMRRCTAISRRSGGGRCGQAPLSGIDHCIAHARSRALPVPDELVDRARRMHEDGMYLHHIAVALIDQTPYTSPHSLAARFASIADRDGWHRTAHLGKRRLQHLPKRAA